MARASCRRAARSAEPVAKKVSLARLAIARQRSAPSPLGSIARVSRRAPTTTPLTLPSGAERHRPPIVIEMAARPTSSASPISRATATASSMVATSNGHSVRHR